MKNQLMNKNKKINFEIKENTKSNKDSKKMKNRSFLYRLDMHSGGILKCQYLKEQY